MRFDPQMIERFNTTGMVGSKMMTSKGFVQKYNLVTNPDGVEIACYPFVPEDGNHGLPDWVFEDDYLIFEVTGNKVEWIPECGPAPCYEGTMDGKWFERFDTWFNKTYGDW